MEDTKKESQDPQGIMQATAQAIGHTLGNIAAKTGLAKAEKSEPQAEAPKGSKRKRPAARQSHPRGGKRTPKHHNGTQTAGRSSGG